MSTTKNAAETALTDAREVLDAKRQELRDAEQLVAKIRNAWDRGSDEYSSLDKMAAEGDVERLTKATAIAFQQAKHAERRLRALAPALAERAALAIGDTVFGIEAKAVTSRPTKSTTDVQVSVVESQIYEPADDHTGGNQGTLPGRGHRTRVHG